MRGRRLGVVTTSYPREPGDPAGGFVAGFARWLAAEGAEVEVIAAGPGERHIDGIPVVRVPGQGLFYEGGAPDALATFGLALARAGAFQAALAAATMARVGRWDGLVSHWVVPCGLAAETARALLRRKPRPPHLAIAHSSDVWLLRRSKAGRAWLRALAARADLVYAGPHLPIEGAPGRVVPMGIDAAACRGDRVRGRRRFSLQDESRPVALFLGRLVPVKGLDLLLEALPDELDLLVAGAGPLRAAWERAAPPRVRFLGEVRGEALRDLLAAVDLLVVPSRCLPDGRQEGTPTVIFEAQAAGLPVVATRTGGAEAVVRDGIDGLLVAPEPDALGAALRRLATDPALRRRLHDAIDRDARDWRRIGPILAYNLGLGGSRGADDCAADDVAIEPPNAQRGA